MKDKIGGLFQLLAGGYFAWIAYDCYQEQTLASNQINAIAVIAVLMILSSLYYLFKQK